MNYSQLKDIQKKERDNNSLSLLPKSFYSDVANYFYELEHSDDINIREYHNAFNCYSEIMERRLFKITHSALYRTMRMNKLNQIPDIDKITEEPLHNIHSKEEKTYLNLIKTYINFYSERYEDYFKEVNK